MTETVTFLGEEFRIADRVSRLAIMRFARLAKQDEVPEQDALAAMYDLLKQCIHPDEWSRFEGHADEQRADEDDLMRVVQETVALVADRPTSRSSDSSGGPRTIEPSSPDDSSSTGADAVIHRFNENGRPDLALLVRKRQESLTA